MCDVVENPFIRLELDRKIGGLCSITNKLTNETYTVRDDAFRVETGTFRRCQQEMSLSDWSPAFDGLQSCYTDTELRVEVFYKLGANDHFFQKHVALTFADAVELKQVILSQPLFWAPGLEIVCYHHPDLQWVVDYVWCRHRWSVPRPPDSNPSRTFFGRTAKGGFFTGVEIPYDNSRLDKNVIELGYAPNLKVSADNRHECESIYFGVYRRGTRDFNASDWAPLPPCQLLGMRPPDNPKNPSMTLADSSDDAVAAINSEPRSVRITPLPSESVAMTSMISRIFGPPRHGLMAFACGWHSQMHQDDYENDEQLEGDLGSLEFLAECGLDGVTDCHPWGGESQKVSSLQEGDRYELGARSRQFLEHARKKKLIVMQWSTMNHSHPWRPYGRPFRSDRPEWLREIDLETPRCTDSKDFRLRVANCFACEPFYEWLEGLILDDTLATRFYDAWALDGDFWGSGGYVNTTIPVTCASTAHDHLGGDSNYACQRRLNQLITAVRERFPAMYIAMCRPAMDLGVWALRHVDACFTLIESGTDKSNIIAGNHVRTASRIRVHHHFFPHWLDWSLLFPSFENPKRIPEWPRGHIDYIMLSALSCSPNLLLYLPTKSGIPEEDKKEIKKWLDWGRANVKYLLVRHDLFDWPGKGKVDGSAHLMDNEGLIFLFNSTPTDLKVTFDLTPECIGFRGTESVDIWQEYPSQPDCHTFQPGAHVAWLCPAESAIVLRITPHGT